MNNSCRLRLTGMNEVAKNPGHRGRNRGRNRYRYTTEFESGPEWECRASQRRPFFALAFMLAPDFRPPVTSRHRLASLHHNPQRKPLLKRHWSKWENRHH